METKEFFDVVRDKLQQFDTDNAADIEHFINDIYILFDEWDEEQY